MVKKYYFGIIQTVCSKDTNGDNKRLTLIRVNMQNLKYKHCIIQQSIKKQS